MQDFIVIGGGIAGLSAGARLSHLGRVLVLEAEAALGHHASGRSAALFEATYGSPSTVALNHASQSYHREANGGVLSPRGMMLLAAPGQEAQFDADREAMRMEEISPDAAAARVPILDPARLARAAVHESAWDIDTDLLMQNFLREIRAAGGELRTRHAVTAIRRDTGRWLVEAAGTIHEGRVLVNAAGAWADLVARLAGAAPLGVQPMRRSMARLPAPGGHDVSRWPMIFGAGESWYAKPDAGALLVSPAEEHPMEPHDAWADDLVLAEGLARYEAFVTVPLRRPLASWAGLRTFAPDRNLVIGRDAAVPDLWWTACQGGYGFQTAPAASQLLADLVAGRPPALEAATVAALDPARFH